MSGLAIAGTVAGIVWAAIQEGLKQGASLEQIRQAMADNPDIPDGVAEALLKDITSELPD